MSFWHKDRRLPCSEWSALLCLTLGWTEAVSDGHRVELRDLAGRPVEHPAPPTSRHLTGAAAAAGGDGALRCGGGGLLRETQLDIPAVPGPGDAAVTNLQGVAVLQQQAERGKLLAVVSVPGEPLTLRSTSALDLAKYFY